MPTPRNLFRLRMAEQAQTDDQFLALFSSRVVELLREGQIWDRLVRFESAPGGGKTSLLRLFTPGSLTRVFRMRHHPDNQELVKQLQGLGVIDDAGVQLLGVYVNCHHDYSQIAELSLDSNQRRAWFISLLGARSTLLMLKAACQMGRIRYPDDAGRISFQRVDESLTTDTFEDVVSGADLYVQAKAMEAEISGAINHLGRTPTLDLSGQGRLELPLLLSNHRAYVDGRLLAKRGLLMFDDTHTTDRDQQSWLADELERHDVTVARWMAMRLTALSPAEAMSEPATEGRESLTIRLDDWTRATFEKWLIDIADRRAIRAESTIHSFQSLLADFLTSDVEFEAASTALVSERSAALESAATHSALFTDWFEATERSAAFQAPSDAAAEWARLRILVERRLQRRQIEFEFASLPEDELTHAPGDLLEVGRLFVASRNDVPYYFGVKRIAQLGSWNVEQFLRICAELFDALVNAGLVSRSGVRELSGRQQDRIARAVSRAFLASIQRDVPYGVDVHNLVTALGTMARQETYRPSAPYAPGVTGFAISMRERAHLIARPAADNGESSRLLRALHAAITHNILKPSLDRRVKGGEWMVLYLNRLLCPSFDLPLGYGGFREQKLSEVERWVVDGTPSVGRQLKLA